MSETVSKTKEVTPSPQAAPVAEVVEEKRKTVTNWRVFEEGGFIPVRVKCDGYLNSHPADQSCHSNILPTPESILRHADPAHGVGAFKIKFRISDSKTSPLWRGLEEAGVELQNFYCPHCREVVPVSPRRMIYHLNPHPGANRMNLNPQTLCMTLGVGQSQERDEYSDLYE